VVGKSVHIFIKLRKVIWYIYILLTVSVIALGLPFAALSDSK